MKTHSISSFLGKKLAALAIIAVAVALPAQARTVVTDTWSGVPAGQTGGAWIAARDQLAAATPTAINGGTWNDAANWTNSGLAPHAIAFVADAGSTGGAALSAAGQTKYPFASAAQYFNTVANVAPAFNVVDASALAGVGTVTLTIIGLNNTLNAAPSIGVAPVLSHDGGATTLAADAVDSGVSDIVMFGTTKYRFVTYTWDVSSLDVAAFEIDWAAGVTASYIHQISVSQTAAAVPEPSAFAGLAGAAVLGGALLRRRRRA